MKDNSLDGHRGKVAIGDSGINKQPAERGKTIGTSSTTNASSVSRVLSGTNAVGSAAIPSASSEVSSPATGGQGATNFDDDYNEWELGIGDLIIDLDADIEKNNEKNSGATQNGGLGPNGLGVGGGATCLPSSGSGGVPGSSPSSVTSPTSNSSGAVVNNSSNAGLSRSLSTTGQSNLSSSDRVTMSSSKSSRLSGGIGSNANATNGGSNNGNNSGVTTTGAIGSSAAAAAVEHQATVDKGLKMKIKRKNVGSKSSEAKHEIVQSDTSKATSLSSHHQNVDGGVTNATVLNTTSTSTPTNAVNLVSVAATPVNNVEPKSKHSSGKGRSGSHRDKKEKSRDKEKDKSKGVTGSSGNASTVNTSSVESNGTTSNCNLPSGAVTAGGSTTAVKISNAGVTGANSSNLTTQQSTSNNPCLGTLAQLNGTTAGTTGNASGTTGIVISGASPLGGTSSNVNHPDQSVGVTNCGGVSGLNGPSSAMPSGSVVSSIPNLTVKLEKYGSPTSGTSAAGLGVTVGGGANVACPPASCSVISKTEELPKSPPVKRLKIEKVDRVDGVCSPIPPETQDTGTCTSIGTVTEPECLGPCEPGTSVLLEGIVWQETEGAGVLVVNVTWRGKTYVGTLLDCTKHDWAPPRLCESPISDMDAKTAKGRGKRGRGSANNSNNNNNSNNESNFTETRTAVQSKLRNGKGRRNGNSGFTVPNSPARSNVSGVAESAGKRKGRPVDLELSPTSSDKGSKRSRTQSRNVPGTPGNNGNSGGNSVDFSQPSSPTLIECPEPNCSKKYKHINGLRYHQTHAHSGNQEATSRSSEEPNVSTATTAEETSKDSLTTNVESEENARTSNTPGGLTSVTNASSVPPSPVQPVTPTNFGSSPSPKAAGSGTNNALRNAQPTRVIESVGNAATTNELGENFEMNSDLSTLASVAISDLAASNSNRFTTNLPSSTVANSVESKSKPLPPSAENNLVTAPLTSSSVIQQTATPAVIVSAGSTPVTQTPSVTVSIPTSHVMSFAGQLPSSVNNSGGSVTTGQANVAFNSHSAAGIPVVYNLSSTTSTGATQEQNFPAGATTGSVPAVPPLNPPSLASSPLNLDKNKAKQDKMDRYKSQKIPPTNAPSNANLAVRPMPSSNVPISGTATLQAISAPQSSHVSGMNASVAHSGTGGALLTASLKPIQPKPTILGEPTTVNPALESLKKEKSKHKKKCKDKDKKSSTPSVGCKISGLTVPQGEPGERVENLSGYHPEGLHNPISSRDPIGSLAVAGPNSQPVPSVPGLCNMGGGTPSRSLDLTVDANTPESTMNENVQSPAYSDISDANDTAPVLESEVAVSEKEKDDKTLKTTSEAAPSPSGNIASYGMYYYGQPPYLIPSVPTQNASPPSSEKVKETASKKSEPERAKDSSKISWGSIDMTLDNRSGEQTEPQNASVAKKSSSRDEMTTLPQPNAANTAPSSGLPEYQQSQAQQQQQQQTSSTRQSPLQQVQQPSLQQGYPYPYGYMQGFPYGMDPNYHMHMLAGDPHYKQQQERLMHEQERMYKEHQHQQHHQTDRRVNHGTHGSSKEDERNSESRSSSSRHSDAKRPTQPSSHYNRDRESSREPRESSQTSSGGMMMANHIKRETPPSSNYSSSAAAAASLKEKQSENHQIMKENIELKSQMDSGKAKYSHYEANAMIEKQREEIRRYYLMQDYHMEHPKLDEGAVYTHHGSHPSGRKEESAHYSSKHGAVIENRGPPCVSPHKSVDHHSKVHGTMPSSKSSSSSASGFRDSHHSSKEHGSSGGSKSKDVGSKGDSHHESKEDSKSKSSDKSKSSSHGEGQKPTMETTGPPPPPTNSYAYLHASYLQPPPHFAHMPFDPTHPVYRGGLNPILMSAAGPAAAYGGSPYFNPQLRYHVPHGPPPPGPCDLPPPQPPGGPGDSHHHHLSSKMHPSSTGPSGNGPQGGTKALDLLHQVSQHYTTHSTHKIHELQERALMSPSSTPNSVSGSATTERRESGTGSNNPTPSSPTSGTGGTGTNSVNAGVTHGSGGKVGSNAEPSAGSTKQDCTSASGDRSRSPPPQRHLHTHHHTHVGVGYPIYDPYGAVIASQQAAAAVVAAGHSFVPK